MAGKLVIDTLQDGSGNSTSATNAIMGSAKAWVNFNGVTTATIRASYNVSSVTRNATGDYTVNFTNALADANYAATSIGPTNSGTGVLTMLNATTAPTSSAVRIATQTPAGAFSDQTYVHVAIFR